MPNYSMRDCLICEDRTMHDGALCLDCKNNKLSYVLEYMKIHLISLEQDSAFLQKQIDEFVGDYESWEWEELNLTDVNNTGQMQAVRHIIDVAEGRI